MSQIASLASLYTAITRLLDGEDPTASDLSTASLDQLVSAAQRRIYREVQSRWNEKPWANTVTGNLAPLPSDYASASIVHFGRWPLKPLPAAVLQERWAITGGDELYFAQAGANLTFSPPIADGTALQGRYFARLPDLTDANFSSNTLAMNADDLFVYASLVESAPFFGARTDMPTWEAKYESIVAALNLETERAAYSAGRIQQRGRPVCR